MNRYLILGLPIAKSVLYERRSLLIKSLKSNHIQRNNHTISSPRQNMRTEQRNGLLVRQEGAYKTPVYHETFRTYCVRHQATRRRVLQVCE